MPRDRRAQALTAWRGRDWLPNPARRPEQYACAGRHSGAWTLRQEHAASRIAGVYQQAAE